VGGDNVARLSDFQTAPVVRNLEAERLVGVHARRVHRNFVDYRRTSIQTTLGAVEAFASDASAAVRSYGRDAVASVTKRQKVHAALDKMMSEANMTLDDAPRLHRALDKLLDSELGPETQNRILHEPEEEEGDSDEEEIDEEEEQDDAEENEDPNEKVKIPYDSLSLDQLERTLNKTLGLDDGAGLSRIIAMDSDSLRLGEPDAIAMDAIQKLPVSFDINKPAKAPWFSTMMSWISKYPKDAKVRDLHQPTLHKLLHELEIAA
jgi:hypothetical protein